MNDREGAAPTMASTTAATLGATPQTVPASSVPAPPPPLLTAQLADGEAVLWWAQPIRPPSGRASLIVGAAGALFVVAALGAILELVEKARAGAVLAAASLSPFALLFLAF